MKSSLRNASIFLSFCYDNDVDGKLPDGTSHNHGQVYAENCAREFRKLGYKTAIQTPNTKDFNNDLKNFLILLAGEPSNNKEEMER